MRNLDEAAYRRAKARAALEGKTVGEVISEALLSFTQEEPAPSRTASVASPPTPKARGPAGGAHAGRFRRPFPRRGAFVENPMILIDTEATP